MTVVQQMRIKSELVALFVFDIVGQLVKGTIENVSILRDTHRQMTSKRLKMDCLPVNAGEMADRTSQGRHPPAPPLLPTLRPSADTRGVGNR